jgi:hypothetical protein
MMLQRVVIRVVDDTADSLGSMIARMRAIGCNPVNIDRRADETAARMTILGTLPRVLCESRGWDVRTVPHGSII